MFLDDPNTEEVKEIMEKNKGVKEAIVKVRELTEDEKMERLAFLREKAILDEKLIRRAGYKKGREEGVELGKEQGQKEGIELEKENMIKSMILNKLADEKIKEIAKIDDKELNRIKKLLNNK